MSEPSVRGYRFGPFEVNLRSGEVRKNGVRIRVPDQPFRVLVMLLEHPGEMVTREELRDRLWGADTFVDFENGLNAAINRVREALGDSAEAPSFIETLPRRGYRFLAPAEVLNGSSILPTGLASEKETLPSTTGIRVGVFRKRIWLAAMVAVLLVGVAAGSIIWKARHPALAFHSRDWVLITNFENRTGEAVLDGTLEFALERELCNSQFVNVVPRDRVNDTLRLMRKPLDARIDGALGQEISLRDGGIRALLTGRIEKLGTRYLLAVALVDPAHGATVASMSEEASNQNEILPAMRRLSDGVRQTLGEKLSQIRQQDETLEKATTPSLRALQLYSRGIALANTKRHWEQAAVLFEQALAEDPQFASAHIYLAHSYSNVGKHEEAAPHYQQAFALAGAATDRERYFIQGSYYERFLMDKEKAAQEYELLLRFFPDDFWGNNNLAQVYWWLGRYDESHALDVRLSDLRPNFFPNSVRAAIVILERDKSLAQARPYLLRAQALASPETVQLWPYFDAWMHLLPAYAHWLNGEAAQALNDAREMEQTVGSVPDSERNDFRFRLADFYSTVGKLKAAEDWYQTIVGDPFWANQRDLSLGWLAYLKSDRRGTREHLKNASTPGLEAVILMARMGYLADVEKMLESVAPRRSSYAPGAALEIARGELALARGRTEEGLTLIERNIHNHSLAWCLGMESLAAIYERRGDLSAAAGALEEAYKYQSRGLLDHDNPALYFFDIGWRLAQEYRKQGRVGDAQKVEAELLKLLGAADPDHPILVELNRLKATAAAIPPASARH